MRQNETITFITGNEDKARMLSRYLSHPVERKKIHLDEIQSLDIAEVVAHKAKEAYTHIGSTVLVEDTALTFNALGRLPGTFVKWFLEEIGNEGLCRLLDPYEDKSAYAQVMYGLYDGSKMQVFTKKMNGQITPAPQGPGFGWTPIFVPEGAKTTWGEMTEEEQDNTSLRKLILKDLKSYLDNL